MKRLAMLFLLVLGLAFAQTRGGELVVSLSAEPPILNPNASTSQDIARMMYDNVLQGLVKFDRTGEIVPALAESWEVSEDGLTYTFNLREGVTYHDGSAFDAEDVVSKFERARDPESGHVQTRYYADIAEIEAPDAHTVVFRLDQLNSEFLFNLARPESVIGPAGRVEEQDVEPIGTGPFRFVEWERGVAVDLERFEDYYVEELPYLDGVTFRFITDPQAQLAALRTGDIDVIGYGMSPENAIVAEAEPNLKTVIGSATTPVVMGMNNARAPFDDIRVRQAIQHAVNKEELVEGVMLGLGEPIGSHRTPVEPCYVDLTGMYPHDPERARELLAEAGYGPDNPLRFTYTIPAAFAYARTLGEASASQLARVGIEADIEIVEFSTWLSRVFRGQDYDMSIIGHSEPNDINVYANPDYYFQYDSEEFRDTYDTYLRTADPDEACGLMEELQRIIAEDAVNVWIMELPYIAAMQQDVTGWWENQPSPSLNVTEVYRDR